MTSSNHIYRFRVSSIQDLPLPDSFLLHVFVQHDQPPRYLDLLNKIQQYSKTTIHNIHDYYMIIEKENAFQYTLKDDLGLQNVFKSITDQDNKLEIKLMKKINEFSPSNNNVPLIKPIFIRPNYIDAEAAEEEYRIMQHRKDSGISLEQEKPIMLDNNKPSTKKLPALPHIITTPNNNHKSSIKLPGLSSIIIDHDPNHQHLAPIYAYNHHQHPYPFDHEKPLSPPLSASSPSPSPLPPYNNLSPPPPPPTRKVAVATNKRARGGGGSHPPQFVCEQIIDKISGKTCCQTFHRSYDLSRHQTIHLKNRPLCHCHDCGKKFTRLDALRRHQRIQGHNDK